MTIRKIAFRAIGAAALISTFLQPISAQALTKFRPSLQWGFTYAAPASKNIESSPVTTNKYLEKKSSFVIEYHNFPEWAKNELQAAADVWAENFESTVPIYIDATFSRSQSFSILGSARPGQYAAGFKGAPDPSLWYPSALANALAGRDLDGDNPEMIIQVNSLANWYQGGGGGPTRSQYDMQSVFLHEMAHGLGFLSTDSYDKFFSIGSIDQPTPFDAFIQTGDGRRLSDLPSPSPELGEALTSKLIWSGSLGNAANGGTPIPMYTPVQYEDGSSVSHIDEATYSNSGFDAVMTPNLEAGEVFHQPGPLLLAMMQDLRTKPPAGIATGIPEEVRNARALISDSELIITFDPPANARAAQISSYTIKNLKTGAEKSFPSSPALWTGLINGTSYSFSIIANNSNGKSSAVTTSAVAPQKEWDETVIDPNADGALITSTSLNGQPAIAYTDSRSGALKIALWTGRIWKRYTVDGRGGSGGRTRNPISGDISLCVSGFGTKQMLHIFYSDKTSEDLRYATFDGKNFVYEIVDGNALTVNKYEDPIRVRTKSNVGVSIACIANSLGVQVFYRDEDQGILLGASKSKGATNWIYELVDGDRKTDGRTTGDVAFHISAFFDGKKSWIIYDSVLGLNTRKEITAGAVRIANRTGTAPESWNYQTLDSTAPGVTAAGYDVTFKKSAKGLLAAWMISNANSFPHPEELRWTYVSDQPTITSVKSTNFGRPSKFLSSDGKYLSFNCHERLCALDLQTGKISLASKEENADGIESAWIVQGIKRFLVAGVNQRLVALKAQ